MIGILSNSERHDQMQQALNRFPFLKKRQDFNDEKVSIVCYGPSLADTWRQIRSPMITVSGAHDYMIRRGRTPDWHVEIDPRPHKAKMLKYPQQATRYLMASVCHPDFWEILEGFHVELWHLINDQHTIDWVSEHHPHGMGSLIGGGSTAGHRAMNVAASALGFRRFDVYGMDCSLSSTDQRHAGPHTGMYQLPILVAVGDMPFRTTRQLRDSAREMEDFIQSTDVEITFHGDGLMQELARLIHKRKVKQSI